MRKLFEGLLNTENADVMGRILSLTMLMVFGSLLFTFQSSLTGVSTTETYIFKTLFLGISLTSLFNLLKPKFVWSVSSGVITAITGVIRLLWLANEGIAVGSLIWLLVSVSIPMASAVAYIIDNDIRYKK